MHRYCRGDRFGTENYTVDGGGSDTNCCVVVGANGEVGVGTVAVDVGISSKTFNCTGLRCALESCSHACYKSGKARGNTEST